MWALHILAFSLLAAIPGQALVLGSAAKKAPSSAHDTRPIARIHTPTGLLATGTLLSGGHYLLTAAHVVADHPPATYSRGIIDFPSLPGSPRRQWKSVHLHPKSLNPSLAKIWDIALIELSEPIPQNLHPGLSITTTPVGKNTPVLLTGFGRRGDGTLGDHRPPGPLTTGFNHFDLPLDSHLRSLLNLSPGPLPLLLHRFDPQRAEAHFATGDSGGPGLILTPSRQTLIASVNLARLRGPSDSDHRLNGSFGELGLSLDASTLQSWLSDFLQSQTNKPNRNQ